MIETEIDQDEFEFLLGKVYQVRRNNLVMDYLPILEQRPDEDIEKVILEGKLIAKREGAFFYKYDI